METFKELESNVQTYARSYPVLFEKAEGSYIWDSEGNRYLDFLAGAGSLNYGHNNPILKNSLVEYILGNGIAHSLDFHTFAKERFLSTFNELILQPRNLQYVMQFTGPTGANAVEAALKLARGVTGRHNILSFTNGFHGVTMGAMATTGNSHHRDAAGLPLIGVTPVPYDEYMGDNIDTTEYIDKILSDGSSGVDHPAAIILETVQGEGGLNAASMEWLQAVERLCRKHDMLLIVDDIQAGCGRTGTFFSFEPAGISPDIVTLSKSISGFGLPFALTLIKPEYDQWKPGEHNGTFRGNNHAFVTAQAALEHYWHNEDFADAVQEKAALLGERLEEIAAAFEGAEFRVKGRGMMVGIDCGSGKTAGAVSREAFKRGMIIETSGSDSEVVKCLCPLTISLADLNKGLDILHASIAAAVGSEIGKEVQAA